MKIRTFFVIAKKQNRISENYVDNIVQFVSRRYLVQCLTLDRTCCSSFNNRGGSSLMVVSTPARARCHPWESKQQVVISRRCSQFAAYYCGNFLSLVIQPYVNKPSDVHLSRVPVITYQILSNPCTVQEYCSYCYTNYREKPILICYSYKRQKFLCMSVSSLWSFKRCAEQNSKTG